MKRLTRKPSPVPVAADGRHHTPDDHKPGFTYAVPQGEHVVRVFVPFAWYANGSTNVVAARRAALLRASAYGEVPEGLAVVADPL